MSNPLRRIALYFLARRTPTGGHAIENITPVAADYNPWPVAILYRIRSAALLGALDPDRRTRNG